MATFSVQNADFSPYFYDFRCKMGNNDSFDLELQPADTKSILKVHAKFKFNRSGIFRDTEAAIPILPFFDLFTKSLTPPSILLLSSPKNSWTL